MFIPCTDLKHIVCIAANLYDLVNDISTPWIPKNTQKSFGKFYCFSLKGVGSYMSVHSTLRSPLNFCSGICSQAGGYSAEGTARLIPSTVWPTAFHTNLYSEIAEPSYF
jgi:hypothetical protein